MSSLLLERRMFPCRHGRLPSQYQECEYIESTGLEYIKSGIECPNTYVDATFQFKTDTAMPSIGIGTWNYGHRFQVVRANTDGFTYDIGEYQYTHDGYVLPAIEVTLLRSVYENDRKGIPQVLYWHIYGSENNLKVVSSDHILTEYSMDLLVHNKYHCEYKWTNNTTGIVNPNVE